MKLFYLLAALFLLAYSSFASESLEGVWCSDEDGLILTFGSEDSVYVSSTTEESLKGEGTFQQNDSTLSAKIDNEELTIEMSYNFHWIDQKTIKAKPLFFRINGDDISVPSEWVKMVRCDKQEEKKQSKDKE